MRLDPVRIRQRPGTDVVRVLRLKLRFRLQERHREHDRTQTQDHVGRALGDPLSPAPPGSRYGKKY